MENLTGQNNSLLQSYETFETNIKNAHVDVTCVETKVSVIRLDDYVSANGLSPNLIKIELRERSLTSFLAMTNILSLGHAIVMVEVTEKSVQVQSLLLGKATSCLIRSR